MDEVARIREKIDIVSFIAEFIPLKKAGRNFKANCPFHTEKNPSFMVNPERQIWHCFGCFPPGEKIKTPFGYHNIEEIDQSHFVISGKGNIRKVLAVMKHEYKGDLISVKIRKLGGEVRLSSDHNVFVVRGAPYLQKQYKNFSRRYNKYLKIRKTDKARYQQIINKYFPIKEIPAVELQKGDLLLYPINRTITDIANINLSSYISKTTNFGPIPRKIPLNIPLSEDLLKLVGYWIAEGSSHRAYIRFSLGNHEEDFAADIVSLTQKVFGLQAKIYRRPKGTKTGLEITVCHSKLANIFENLCGKGAANKHIPFIFQELPAKKQKILLETIHRGDGTSYIANRSKNLHKAITTISQTLSEQLTDILLRLNFFPTRYVANKKIDKDGVNHKEAYTIFWSEQTRQKYNLIYHQADGVEYWLLPIIKIEKEQYQGPVYNFTVEQDHSYIANNFAVANCGKGGDAYSFLMEYERLEFPEALRMLAKRTGITLPERPSQVAQTSRKEKIYQLNNLAREFYHFVLTRHNAGQKARAYLEERGVTPQIIQTFMLGFAPNTGNTLTKYLIEKKLFPRIDLIDAGLSADYGGRTRDFFRGRLIFPLVDHRDNVVGFSGRVLDKNATTAKYINTRDTIVYHKGDHVYGLNITKEAIRKANQVIICEGEFDVISCFHNGIANVVGVKGTALTENQVNLLARFASKITFCFDGDKAGQEAIRRSVLVVEKKGFLSSVIEIPSGKDPDEALRLEPGLFKKAAREDTGVYDYLLTKAAAAVDPATAEGKKQISDEMLPLLSGIKNEIIKEHYLRKIASLLETSYDSIAKEMQHLAIKEQKVAVKTISAVKRPKEEIMEEYLLSLIIQSDDPKVIVQKAIACLSDSFPNDRACQKILHLLLEHFAREDSFDSQKFIHSLPSELVTSCDTSLLYPLPHFENKQKLLSEVEKVAGSLRASYIHQKMKDLAREIKTKEQEGNEQEAQELKKEYSRLASQKSTT